MSSIITAQIWSKRSLKKINIDKLEDRRNSPKKSYHYNLDSEYLTEFLKKAPKRSEKKDSDILIQLPVVNGEMKSFKIVEASVMSNHLEEKYPSIKSYVGYGVDDPTSIARFSFSKNGFNAMILT